MFDFTMDEIKAAAKKGLPDNVTSVEALKEYMEQSKANPIDKEILAYADRYAKLVVLTGLTVGIHPYEMVANTLLAGIKLGADLQITRQQKEEPKLQIKVVAE